MKQGSERRSGRRSHTRTARGGDLSQMCTKMNVCDDSMKPTGCIHFHSPRKTTHNAKVDYFRNTDE